MDKECECIVCHNKDTAQSKQCPYCFISSKLNREYTPVWIPFLEKEDFQGQQRCMGCFSQPMLEALAFAVEQVDEFGIEVVREYLLAFCHGELETKECDIGHSQMTNVRDFLDVVETIYRNKQSRKQIAAQAAAQIEKKRKRLFMIQNVWQILVCFCMPLFLPLFALFIALTQFPQQFVLGAVFLIICCCLQVALVWLLLQTDWLIKLESPLIQEPTGMPGVAIAHCYLYGAVCYVLALIPYSILYGLLWIPDSPPKYLQWLVGLM